MQMKLGDLIVCTLQLSMNTTVPYGYTECELARVKAAAPFFVAFLRAKSVSLLAEYGRAVSLRNVCHRHDTQGFQFHWRSLVTRSDFFKSCSATLKHAGMRFYKLKAHTLNQYKCSFRAFPKLSPLSIFNVTLVMIPRNACHHLLDILCTSRTDIFGSRAWNGCGAREFFLIFYQHL